MKKLIYTLSSLLLLSGIATAQETVYPAKQQKGLLFITNGTVHVGNGSVIENATVKINKASHEKPINTTILRGLLRGDISDITFIPINLETM